MSKRSIDLSTAGQPKGMTALVYGRSRSGKTEFAGTWPRARFFSDKAEGGYETLRHMPRDKFFEPGRAPEVRAIASVEDMTEEITILKADLQKTPGCVQTAVVDSVTFYADLVLNWVNNRFADECAKNSFFQWNFLFNHLRAKLIELHTMGLNVVWLALADDEKGGPLLSGQMAKKLPALCNWLLYMRVDSRNEKGETIFTHEVRTKQFQNHPAGGRAGHEIDDPLEPTYRALAAAAGYQVPEFSKPTQRPVSARPQTK